MTGVWMWPESIRRGKPEEVFEACRRAGVTDVFFLTKGLAGTAAFLSPSVPPTEPGRDLLREVIDAAHGRGMRLHAWFTSASDAHYKEEHPASGLCHYRDGRNRGIVSVRDAGYIRYMQGLLGELVRRYDVDGVHLDYIRYNHLAFGWSEEDLARYAAGGVDTEHVRCLMEKTFYGENPDKETIFRAFREGDRDVIRLSEIRRENVLAFAEALCGAVRAEKSGIALSAALMPEGAYDDPAFSDLHYGQHYADLAGLMDLFLPMAYSKAYGKDADWVASVARGTLRYGVKTLVGVQAYEGGTGLTLNADKKAAEKTPGAEGVCLFREGAFATAFVGSRTLSLLNFTASAVTSVRIAGEGGKEVLPVGIAPGEEREIRTEFRAETVQAFVGEEKEIPVLTLGA